MKATDVAFVGKGKLDSVNLDRLLMSRRRVNRSVLRFSLACYKVIDATYRVK